MITLEKIKNISFRKANIGGYRAEEVDKFIDEVVELCEALMRERLEVKKREEKMIALVKEYRSREGSVGQALLTAQAKADETAQKAEAEANTVLSEAKSQAELILAEAQNQAREIVEQAQSSVEGEKAVIDGMKDEVVRFKTELLKLYREHLMLINALPDNRPQAEPEQETATEEPQQPSAPADAPAAPVYAEPEEKAGEAAEEAVDEHTEYSLYEAVLETEESVPKETEEPETPPAEQELPNEKLTAARPELFDADDEEDEVHPAKSQFASLEFGQDYNVRESGGLFKRKK